MSDAEEALAFQLKAVGIPFEREVQFAKPRRWRADFVVPEAYYGQAIVRALLIEIDGGAFAGGRHTSGAGFRADVEKLNAATPTRTRSEPSTRCTSSPGTAVVSPRGSAVRLRTAGAA